MAGWWLVGGVVAGCWVAGQWLGGWVLGGVGWLGGGVGLPPVACRNYNSHGTQDSASMESLI